MKINSNVINLIIISIITQIIQVSPAYSNTYKEPEILKDDISQNYLTELHSQKYNYRLKEYQDNLNTKFIKEQNHFKKQYQQKEYKDIDIHLTEEDMLFQKPTYTGKIYNAGHMTGFIYQTIGGGLAPFSFGMSYPLLSTIPGTAAKIKVGKIYTIYYK